MPQRCGRRRICLGIDRASLRTQLREVALPGGDRRSRCSQGFVVVALLGLGAMLSLYRAYYRTARILAAAQVALVVIGLGLAQWPFVIVPCLTFADALAPEGVVVPMLVFLAFATPVLLLALAFLFKVFKAQRGADPDA